MEHDSHDPADRLPTGAADPAAGTERASGHEPDDHELVRRAQAGDADAFGELVQRHEGRAWRVARQMVPDREEARDLAQEAFLRVYKNLDRFDFQHEFTTWLYRIVTNLGIDHLRRRRPVVARGGGDDDDGPVREDEDESAPQPSERLERAETGALVRRCIDALPEHFRVVLALRELEGLTSQEISRIVGATPVTVRWRLHRARKLFAEQWELLEERRERQRQAAAGGLLEWANLDGSDGRGTTATDASRTDESRTDDTRTDGARERRDDRTTDRTNDR